MQVNDPANAAASLGPSFRRPRTPAAPSAKAPARTANAPSGLKLRLNPLGLRTDTTPALAHMQSTAETTRCVSRRVTAMLDSTPPASGLLRGIRHQLPTRKVSDPLRRYSAIQKPCQTGGKPN